MNVFDAILDNDFSFFNEEIFIPNRPDIPVAQPSYKSINIEGRDGTLTKFKNYKDNEITIDFVFINRINVSQKIRNIMPRILKAKEIRFTDDLEVFYKIKKVEMANPQRSYRYKCDFSVKFTLEPFTYLKCDNLILTTSTSLYNPGSYKSLPTIRVYGTDNVQVTINSRTFSISNITEYADVNSELRRCYKGVDPKNNDMVGDFPYFDVGENRIILSSNVTKLDISPNWRCL